MSTDIDVAAILQPFEGESRVGRDLRSDDDPNNQYRRVRDARNAARDREVRDDRGEARGDRDALAIDLWADVWELGTEYLAEVAKDLEIAAYMIEASLRLDGVAGFANALNLTAELVNSFWGEILPTPDEDGIETTLRPLARLNGDAITYPLQRIRITEDTSSGEFVQWQYEQALRIEKLAATKPEEAQQQISKGAAELLLLKRSVTETPDSFYLKLLSDIETARAALGKLNENLERLVTEEYFIPNLARFSDGLKEVESTVNALVGERLAKAAEEAAAAAAYEEAQAAGEGSESSSDGGDGGAGGGAGGGRSGRAPVMNRELALTQLEEIADWFERNEPQSILPSEIRKVVRRGRMTPEQLYKDLIDDEAVRRQLFRDVGIVPQDSDSSY